MKRIVLLAASLALLMPSCITVNVPDSSNGGGQTRNQYNDGYAAGYRAGRHDWINGNSPKYGGTPTQPPGGKHSTYYDGWEDGHGAGASDAHMDTGE